MFRVPGFTDAHSKIENESHPDYNELPSAKKKKNASFKIANHSMAGHFEF